MPLLSPALLRLHRFDRISASQVPLEAIEGDLSALGLEESNAKRLVEVMEVGDLDGVEKVLGKESPAANEVNMKVG